MDRYFFVRTASLYGTVILTALVFVWRRPSQRSWIAAGLGFVWNVPIILALHILAMRMGWWRFDAEGGLLLGMPVDLWLTWAWLWGAIPLLAFPHVHLGAAVLVALGFDLVFMPAAAPVLHLGPDWLTGEALALGFGFIPGQLLARWTARDQHLPARAVLQMIAFAGLVMLIVPVAAIEGSNAQWINPLERPLWQLSLIVQLLAVPGVLGVSALQEFVERGEGTPVPFDPPRRIVTSGVYAYVRNPMQVSAVLLLLILGVVLGNLWIAVAGVMAHLYSVGLAGWDEDEDLRRRFGDAWTDYRRDVRSWIPRCRPAVLPGQQAQLFVAESCGVCHEVGTWFVRRQARGLTIVPAETHPSRELSRVTYEAADGTTVSGVAAIARALEHIHLGWAFLGFAVRLPVVVQLAQLIVDASGGGPRRIARLTSH